MTMVALAALNLVSVSLPLAEPGSDGWLGWAGSIGIGVVWGWWLVSAGAGLAAHRGGQLLAGLETFALLAWLGLLAGPTELVLGLGAVCLGLALHGGWRMLIGMKTMSST